MTPTPPNTELAACPFCGGEADTWIENEDDPDTECATCPNPDCVGSQVRTAVEHWNTRHLATLREDKGGVVSDVQALRSLSRLLETVDVGGELQKDVLIVRAAIHNKAALKNPSDAGGDLDDGTLNEDIAAIMAKAYPQFNGSEILIADDIVKMLRKRGLLHPKPAPPQADTPIKGAGEPIAQNLETQVQVQRIIDDREYLGALKLEVRGAVYTGAQSPEDVETIAWNTIDYLHKRGLLVTTPAPIDAEVREALKAVANTLHLLAYSSAGKDPELSKLLAVQVGIIEAALKKGG